MNCAYCGTPLGTGARFCGGCGRPAKAPALTPSSLESSFDTGEPDFDAEVTLPRGKARSPAHADTVADRNNPGLNDMGDPYLGKTLEGRFRVEGKLGEGGFGAVYRGTQVGTGRRVAIKLLHPEMIRDDNIIARFRREGQVLCNLRDAHTITTYDFAQTRDGTLYIAMELLEGRSLHEVYHTEAPIDWRRMLKIVRECCSSLAEAHRQGIIHRDLKPENIHLETRPGNPEFVKILDFGIAKVIHGEGFGRSSQPQLTATGQTLGTLEYMSPEQLMGKELDGRSDIYGLGVVAYELITGQLPFPDATGPAALIAAQLKKTPRPPSAVNPTGQIPPQADALILRMLEKHRDNRYVDVDALRVACDAVLGAEAGPPGASSPSLTAFPTPTPPPHTPPPHTPPPQSAAGFRPVSARAGSLGPAPVRVSGYPAAPPQLAPRRRFRPWMALALLGVAGVIAVVAVLVLQG